MTPATAPGLIWATWDALACPHTWISTSWAISYVGARPVYVDIDPVTYTLDPELARQAITSRTKAILPVHLYGQAADVTALARLAQEHDLALIEDAAQAHGACCQERRIGSFGKAACFSFYPGKNLGAFGEGGAVATDDDTLAERIRWLRDHAQKSRHCHAEIGFNTRMEGVQGAVLDVKLRHLDDWNAARRRHAQRYQELLAGIPGLVLPAAPDAEGHVWHLFVIQIQGTNRDELRERLAAKGVATGVHYPTPVPFQPAYAHLGYQRGDFPVAEAVMASCLSLPMFPELTEGQITYVAAALRDCLESGSAAGGRRWAA